MKVLLDAAATAAAVQATSKPADAAGAVGDGVLFISRAFEMLSFYSTAAH